MSSGRRVVTGESVQRSALSTESVIAVAASVARAIGIDRITMTQIAKRVGVTPMALYRHVGNIDNLRRLVMDEALAGVELPSAEIGGWRERFVLALRNVKASCADYPGLADYLLTEGFLPSPNSRRIAAWFIDRLHDAGVRDDEIMIVFATFTDFFLAGLVRRNNLEASVDGGAWLAGESRLVPNPTTLIAPDERFEFALTVFADWLERRSAIAEEAKRRRARK